MQLIVDIVLSKKNVYKAEDKPSRGFIQASMCVSGVALSMSVWPISYLQLEAVCVPAKVEVLHYEWGSRSTCKAVTQH